MWSLFVVLPSLTAIATVLSSLTGGMSFVTIGVAVIELQRRRGYKPGEGEFTERAGNAYYAVCFDSQSEYDLNRELGRIAENVPSMFQDLIKFKFDMTKSEGEILRAMVISVIEHLDKLEDVKDDAVANGNIEALNSATKQFISAVLPMRTWLAQFPRKKFL